MTELASMRLDMFNHLQKWGQDVDVYVKSVSYDSQHRPTVIWNKSGTIKGDWQPVKGDRRGGNIEIVDAGEIIKIDSVLMTTHDATVGEGNKIEINNEGMTFYVRHIKRQIDHKVLLLTLVEGQE